MLHARSGLPALRCAPTYGAPAVLWCLCSLRVVHNARCMQEAEALGSGYMGSAGREGENLMKEVILLAACGAGEVLPQSPDLPADVFTACLTTPIKVKLPSWSCPYMPLCSCPAKEGLLPEVSRAAHGCPLTSKRRNWSCVRGRLMETGM